MAKQVKLAKGKEFNFAAAPKGGVAKFPWEEWLDGSLLLLEQSEGEKDDKGNVVKVTKKLDYEADTNAMPGKLKSAARRRYKIVQISRLDADGKRLKNALIIRARNMTPEERVEEDKQRVIDKAKNAERRAKADPDATSDESE